MSHLQALWLGCWTGLCASLRIPSTAVFTLVLPWTIMAQHRPTFFLESRAVRVCAPWPCISFMHFFQSVLYLTVCNGQSRLSMEIHCYQQALSPNLPSCSQDPPLQTRQTYVHGVFCQHRHHNPGYVSLGTPGAGWESQALAPAIQPTLS